MLPRRFPGSLFVSKLLRDKELLSKFAFSKSELHRRRQSDPDFPPSFLSGPAMRVTEESDVDVYIEILRQRACARRIRH